MVFRLPRLAERGLEIAGLTSIALLGACDGDAAGEGNVNPGNDNSGYEDVWEGDDAYVPVDDFVAPDTSGNPGDDTVSGGEDTEQGTDSYEGNLAPIARACRDSDRKSDNSCKPLELESGKFYVFNFADIPDSQYANSIDPAAGDYPVPGHPTRSEDLDGNIEEYCVQWGGGAWVCNLGTHPFYKHFESGNSGVIRVGVVDDQGAQSTIDEIKYTVK